MDIGTIWAASGVVLGFQLYCIRGYLGEKYEDRAPFAELINLIGMFVIVIGALFLPALSLISFEIASRCFVLGTGLFGVHVLWVALPDLWKHWRASGATTKTETGQ